MNNRVDSLRTGTLRKFLLYHALVIWRTKSFWIRAILCWLIGAAVLVNDEFANFDLRLQIRGPRPASQEIVIIDISEREWSGMNPDSRNVLRPLKEVVNLSDAFFWNPRAWERLLTGVLAEGPRAVGIVFFFGDNVRTPMYSPQIKNQMLTVFEDPRVVWGADIDSAGRILMPTFATTYAGNVGLRGIRADDDGTVRRFSTAVMQTPHLGVKLAEIASPSRAEEIAEGYRNATLIDFAGSGDVFKIINFKDLLEGRVAKNALENKIVLIGSLTSPLEQMQTPLGRMSRTEVMANIVDNVLGNRAIRRAPNTAYLALLTALMGGSIWVLATYPQTVALVFFFMAGVLWAAVSAWAFDIMRFWLPVFAPLVQMMATYMVFLSYQLSLNEQKTWRLEQEQIYLSEIEQLKTNFMSMMSHDLKTPIAKIQAICDRLLATQPDSAIAVDLRSLRRSSDDLHRYIQSILQVTKVEAKDFKISREVTDINENIEKVIGRLAPLAREKNIVIVPNLEPMFSIEADTTLIQEVIHNLIENAIKYSSDGGRITVTSYEKDDNVVVVVEDTGPGIAPEDQKEIWGKFTRGRQQSMEIKGTGLGLYLVKYFIELHGGRVFLTSTLGQGTQIGFSIPVAEDDGAA